MLPTDAKARKDVPVVTGVLDYFPDAIAAIAYVSVVGNQQHNPGQPLHWAKGKSTDHADSLTRHLMERGKFDTDGVRHSAKVAWRALALLQTELENEKSLPVKEGWVDCGRNMNSSDGEPRRNERPIFGGLAMREALRDKYDPFSLKTRINKYSIPDATGDDSE